MGLGELTGLARTPELRVASLAQVTREDVRRAAQEVFQPSGMAVAVVGQLSKSKRKALEQMVRAFRKSVVGSAAPSTLN